LHLEHDRGLCNGNHGRTDQGYSHGSGCSPTEETTATDLWGLAKRGLNALLNLSHVVSCLTV
jgi:hypothetical protein